jgi:hypothetical protein
LLRNQTEYKVKFKFGVFFLVLAAIIALCNALAHLSCLYFGPECYASQLAPEQLIESANNETYLAPLANVVVSTIFIIWGFYALSGAGLIRKLPLLKISIYLIAILCIVRGILPLQVWLRNPEIVNDRAFYYGVGWLITGLLYVIGYRLSFSRESQTVQK